MTDKPSSKHRFIKQLEIYRDREDRAVLAALRRGHKLEMFRYVIEYQTKRNKDFIYMIASLFAWHPRSTEAGNIGDHMLALDPQRENNATERRFMQLLRMRRESIGRPLRQCISILRSNEIPVNWNRLFWDMQDWNKQDHSVQERWARSFWGYKSSESEND